MTLRIVVCGPPYSGKTTVSKYLESRGFERISVGAVIARWAVSNLQIASRRQLLELGKRYLRQKGSIELAADLITEAGASSLVVFDGIRPVETVQEIRRKSSKTVVFYLSASIENCAARQRAERHFSDDEDYLAITDDILERESLSIQRIADYVLENNGDVESLCSRVGDLLATLK